MSVSKKKFLKKYKKEKKEKLDRKSLLRSETKKSIFIVVFFALSLLAVLSFFNGAGVFGQYFLKASKLLFGQGYFFMAISFALSGLAILTPRLKNKDTGKAGYRVALVGVLLFTFTVLRIFYLIGVRNTPEQGGNGIISKVAFANGIETGGYFGLISGYVLARYFGFWAGLIVLVSLLIISILVSFNIPLIFRESEEPEQTSSPEKPAPEQVREKKETLWQKLKKKTERVDLTKGNEPAKEAAVSDFGKQADFQPSKSFIKLASDFKLPPLNFLEEDSGQPTSGDIKANINIIGRTLENFGIEVEMGDVNVGPTVTQYTLRPAQGIKLSKITVLQNDMALALAAHPLRIEAPIPGRSLVGIEIPNRKVVLVRLKTLIEKADLYGAKKAGLIFALGRDVAGHPVLADLCRMPHLLLAGATGSGKTIGLNNLILNLLYQNTPEHLKLILIDPKRVELTAYENIPHLMAPVIVAPDKAVGALRWAVSEMERRFKVLQEAGKRDITGYNNSSQSSYLPYIVIVIDELADLMASHGREAESAIVRLAQMARAVGLHLVVSTQRPSVEVLTGLIKANITSRVAFQVASQIDSRTILDMAGAEKLLGNGDMLYLSGSTAKPSRVQGAYISDKEVKKVSDYLKNQSQPDYSQEITTSTLAGLPGAGASLSEHGTSAADDELYEEAKNIVIESKRASASLLQRRLRVGYARAARLLDILEEKGVVGPADGAKPRTVFIDEGESIEN